MHTGAMKQRIGVISPQRTDLDPLKKDFPDIIFAHGRTPMEFVQAAGSASFNYVLLMDPKLNSDLVPTYTYLRSKPQFHTTPLLVLSDTPVELKAPISDTHIRNFDTSRGHFMPMMEFFNFFSNPKTAHQAVLPQQEIVDSLAMALSSLLPDNPQLKPHEATDDDLHAEYYAQYGVEIACSLFWIKISMRVLNEGSSAFVNKMGKLSDSELSHRLEAFLQKASSDYKDKIKQNLKPLGAVFFVDTEHIPHPLKAPFLKKGQSRGVVLEGAEIKFACEFIRYI